MVAPEGIEPPLPRLQRGTLPTELRSQLKLFLVLLFPYYLFKLNSGLPGSNWRQAIWKNAILPTELRKVKKVKETKL